MDSERYSLIVMSGETAPIRRFEVGKRRIRRVAWTAGGAATAFVLMLLVGGIDYVRLRRDNAELDALRRETAERREAIAAFETQLDTMSSRLATLREFERKVRIIANLPGAAATGGEQVVEVGSGEGGDLEEGAGAFPPDTLGGPGEPAAPEPADAANDAPRTDAERVSALQSLVERLIAVAEERSGSLDEVASSLETKRRYLASSPSIWPAKGWLTSRFGYRISPFTGRRQFHAGIDIAGERGTDIVAPARAVVAFAGTRGPLGKSVILDHGYGVRTHYGHADELHVTKGDEVQRGQVIASLGNTGRSTGPHLHYTVEVEGKARNPLDYIFD